MPLNARRCLGVFREGLTILELIQVTGECTRLVENVLGTRDFRLAEHNDIFLYCHGVFSGLVARNGTVRINPAELDAVVNRSAILTPEEKVLIGNFPCTNFITCITQPCDVAINQLGLLVPCLRR